MTHLHEGCQWQALPSPVQCEETMTRTRDLPVTGGKTLTACSRPALHVRASWDALFFYLGITL